MKLSSSLLYFHYPTNRDLDCSTHISHTDIFTAMDIVIELNVLSYLFGNLICKCKESIDTATKSTVCHAVCTVTTKSVITSYRYYTFHHPYLSYPVY